MCGFCVDGFGGLFPQCKLPFRGQEWSNLIGCPAEHHTFCDGKTAFMDDHNWKMCIETKTYKPKITIIQFFLIQFFPIGCTGWTCLFFSAKLSNRVTLLNTSRYVFFKEKMELTIDSPLIPLCAFFFTIGEELMSNVAPDTRSHSRTVPASSNTPCWLAAQEKFLLHTGFKIFFFFVNSLKVFYFFILCLCMLTRHSYVRTYGRYMYFLEFL